MYSECICAPHTGEYALAATGGMKGFIAQDAQIVTLQVGAGRKDDRAAETYAGQSFRGVSRMPR